MHLKHYKPTKKESLCLALQKKGLSLADIAVRLKISKQRVHEMIKTAQDKIGRLKRFKSKSAASGDLSELGLPITVENYLKKNAGVTTIEELLGKDRESIGIYKGLGPESMKLIVQSLKNKGMRWD